MATPHVFLAWPQCYGVCAAFMMPGQNVSCRTSITSYGALAYSIYSSQLTPQPAHSCYNYLLAFGHSCGVMARSKPVRAKWPEASAKVANHWHINRK
jgi:hypothetical protein